MGIQTHRGLVTVPKGSYVIAVSGGVDSIVLLDILSKESTGTLIVAHFDHGIRGDSKEDADFVGERAKEYGYIYETKREELGAHASEEFARLRRYAFLQFVCKKHNATLITAHHADDVVETIAINLQRGTGWRGLAVFDSNVVRPLLDLTKNELLTYAKDHELTWHEDSTNATDAYLRNRMRTKLARLDSDTKRQLLGLRAQQVFLKKQIEAEVKELLGDESSYGRYFFTHSEETSALELLRVIFDTKLTRPQTRQALLAIKTAKVGKTYQAGNGVEIHFTSRNFKVKLIK
jgi:tRNA(Ile)-lysidine synthase